MVSAFRDIQLRLHMISPSTNRLSNRVPDNTVGGQQDVNCVVSKSASFNVENHTCRIVLATGMLLVPRRLSEVRSVPSDVQTGLSLFACALQAWLPPKALHSAPASAGIALSAVAAARLVVWVASTIAAAAGKTAAAAAGEAVGAGGFVAAAVGRLPAAVAGRIAAAAAALGDSPAAAAAAD